jgi:hypothetical protein
VKSNGKGKEGEAPSLSSLLSLLTTPCGPVERCLGMRQLVPHFKGFQVTFIWALIDTSNKKLN